MGRRLKRGCRIATTDKIYKLNISLSTEAAAVENYKRVRHAPVTTLPDCFRGR